jgi:TRAP-type mannitol/chloroaromatic compound transport system substrate-binding protein
MYHSYEGYFERKSPALHFFGALPFGFTADELFAWVHYGGGQELWDTLSGQFNIKPFLCLNTGTHGRLVHPRDRLAGRVQGAALPDGRARRRGTQAVGRHRGDPAGRRDHAGAQVRRHRRQRMDRPLAQHGARTAQGGGLLLYPGFHEPGTGVSLGINKGVWESFDASDRRVIEAVAACEYARSLAEFNANNALSLRKLRDEGTVKILKFDDSLLKAFLATSKDVVAEIGSSDDLSKKIYASYQQLRASIVDWSDIAERAFLNSRRLA